MSCETEVEVKVKFEVLNLFDLQWLRSKRKPGQTWARAAIFEAWEAFGRPWWTIWAHFGSLGGHSGGLGGPFGRILGALGVMFGVIEATFQALVRKS